MSRAPATRGATTLLPMFGAAIFWGFNWPIVRIMLATSPPWSLRAAGLTGGAIVLFAAAKLSRTPLAIPRASWIDLAVAAVLNVAIFNICTVFAQLSMPTSRAAILTFTMPLWTTLFAWMFLGEAIDRRRMAALSIGVAGLGVLAAPFWPVIAEGGVPFGLIYVLGAAISWALGTVYMKSHAIPAPALAITVWQVALSAVICVTAMAMFETPRLDLTAQPQLLAFIFHILLPQGWAYILWFNIVRRVPAATAAIGTLMVPVFGVLGAVVLLDDWPAPLDMLGLALILGAVLLDQLRPGVK